MAKNPAIDLATYLGTNLGTVALGTDLFHGPEKAYVPKGNVPAECVFCIASGGPPPRLFLQGGNSWDGRYSVQVIVRSDQEDYAGGLVLAKSVVDTLHLATITNWYHVGVTHPEPIYLGKNENDLHRWSINFTLWGTTA